VATGGIGDSFVLLPSESYKGANIKEVCCSFASSFVSLLAKLRIKSEKADA